MSAASVDAAREQLAGDGLRVFDIAQRQGGTFPILQKLAAIKIGRKGTGEAPSGRKNRVSTSVLLLLNQELAALVNAGLPLLRCLDILRNRRSGTVVGSALDRVRRAVASGASLSGAFRPECAHVGIPELFVTSLEVGEASGDLVAAIRRYATHLHRTQALRQRVRSAMVYPIVLLCVSGIVVTILLTVVIPRFAVFYGSSGAELPLLTRLLVGSAAFFASWGLLLLLLVAAGVIAFVSWRRTEEGEATIHAWNLRMPLLGPMRRRFYGLESARTLATLLRGGAPLVRALEVTATGTANVAYRARLAHVAEVVSEGTGLHTALEEQGLLDALGLELVEVGESTGALEEMLEHVAVTYDEVLDRQVTMAVSLIEPAMLVVMGVLVAAILLSLYLPLFNTVQVVG